MMWAVSAAEMQLSFPFGNAAAKEKGQVCRRGRHGCVWPIGFARSVPQKRNRDGNSLLALTGDRTGGARDAAIGTAAQGH